MKKLFKLLTVSLFTVLVAANIFLFCSSLNLGTKINDYDRKTTALHMENLSLDKKISEYSSLGYAKEAAVTLDFTQESQTIYLDKLNFALKY